MMSHAQCNRLFLIAKAYAQMNISCYIYTTFVIVTSIFGAALLPLRICPDLAAPMLDCARSSTSRDALFPAPSYVLESATKLGIGSYCLSKIYKLPYCYLAEVAAALHARTREQRQKEYNTRFRLRPVC